MFLDRVLFIVERIGFELMIGIIKICSFDQSYQIKNLIYSENAQTFSKQEIKVVVVIYFKAVHVFNYSDQI